MDLEQPSSPAPTRRAPIGPGWIVAAAFIGPGTVTTATVAGAGFGTALVWALLFSTLATMILQEMAARLGLVTGQGLGEAIRGRFTSGAGRVAAVALIVGAIAGGNAAYQTGNLLGGSMGLEGIVGGDVRLWVVLLGAVAFLLLWSGSYRIVERFMVAMVGIMSLVFLATAIRILPTAGDWVRDLFIPTIPPGSLLVAVGLIGTTVVPYNLFLHASAVGERYRGEADLPSARLELVLSIGLGGAVSMAILLTAAGTLGRGPGVVTSAADMAASLEPILGSWARGFFAAGLFAAGMTSAVTAPLAAAYATAGAFGWPRDLRDRRLRGVWGAVLGIGVLLGVLGLRPIPAILFAQAANGILLPAVAIFLLVAVNDRGLMKGRENRVASNLLGGVVVLVATLLGARAILSVLGVIG